MKAALIVIDMQNDFRKDASPYSCEMFTEKLVARVKKLIELCRQKNIPVVYTQHTILPDKSNAENGEPVEVRACIKGTSGWEIAKEIEPQPKDDVVEKHRLDAFFETRLSNVLERLGIDTTIICGVWTNNCVRATAEGSYARNYKLILVSDCCGARSFVNGFTAEGTNDLTLTELKERTYETELVTLDEIKNIL